MIALFTESRSRQIQSLLIFWSGRHVYPFLFTFLIDEDGWEIVVFGFRAVHGGHLHP